MHTAQFLPNTWIIWWKKTKGWHTSINNTYHGACILHQHACGMHYHMHAEGWTEWMLPSTLL